MSIQLRMFIEHCSPYRFNVTSDHHDDNEEDIVAVIYAN